MNSGYSTSNEEESSHVELKNKAEITKLRAAARLAAETLRTVSEHIAAGVTTEYLDSVAVKKIRSLGIKPAFKGYRGYPATICASINNELVHGIPRKDRVLKDGDIISVDLGVFCDGYCGDVAATYPVGTVPEKTIRLMDVTRESLEKAMEQVKPGNRLGDVSFAVQQFAEKAGFSVVRDYVGHGIGRKMHEEPAVPNFGEPHTGIRLLPGMVFAIEPMINMGGWQVKTLSDGWTVVTVDGSLCAHFEHMVAVTESGHEVLTRI